MLSLNRACVLLVTLTAGLAAQANRPVPVVPDNLIFEPAQNAQAGVDIVRPRDASGAPYPAVLCIHGGGFRAGDKQSYLPLGIKLAQRGSWRPW